MTHGIKFLLSRKYRASVKEEKAKAKAAAELETKRIALRTNPDLQEFMNWLDAQTRYKRDRDINYVQLGYEAHKRYYNLVKNHPEIVALGGQEIEVSADERVYSWLDDEASWCNWRKDKMMAHYQIFTSQEKEHDLYGDYVLEEIGALGGGNNYAYMAVAYLSYAYWEKGRWQRNLQSLRKILAA